MPEKSFLTLANCLIKMKELGVSDFGHKAIDKDEYSGVFSTSYNWSKI
ncbi:MAG: hypothetical protein AB8B67_02620 [Rickettsiaceae bacterium]